MQDVEVSVVAPVALVAAQEEVSEVEASVVALAAVALVVAALQEVGSFIRNTFPEQFICSNTIILRIMLENQRNSF
jgi:hypothetical protein